jgi:DNA invertase Pin-like site-specific DNA recombinase
MTPLETKDMSKNAAIYLRRSTDRQDQSIDSQRTAIEKYAARNGFSIVREYMDDAISGADTAARKRFLALIEEAQRRDAPFRYVLVYDVSRFGRTDTDEAGFHRHTLTRAGVEVVYTDEGLSGTDADDLLIMNKQWLANRMVKDLSRVTLRGQLARVEKKRWCGGRPPYGYDLQYYNAADQPYEIVRYLDSGDREIRGTDGTVRQVIPRGERTQPHGGRSILVLGDAAKVAVARQIFDWYVNGALGFGAIAERLNREGVVSVMGHRPGTRWKGTWSAGTIREILRNPAYRGAGAWNRISYAKFHRVEKGQAIPRPKTALGRVKRNAQSDWIVNEGQHDPIVSAETFAAAQRLIASRGGSVRDALRSAPRGRYLLAGLIRCARCGNRWQGYRVNKGRKKPGQTRPVTLYYCCGGHISKGNAVCKRALIPLPEFDAAILEQAEAQIRDFLAGGGAPVLDALVAEAIRESAPRDDEKTLRDRIAAYERKIDELVQCLTPALAPTLEPKIVTLRQEADAARADVEALNHQTMTAASAEALVANLMEELGALTATLQTGSDHDRRDVVRALTDQILVNPDTGDVEVTFFAIPRLPSANEQSTDRPFESDLSSVSLMAGARFEPATSGFLPANLPIRWTWDGSKARKLDVGGRPGD